MRVWHYRNGPRCVNLNVSIGLDKPSAAVFSSTITAGPAGAEGPAEHREAPRVRPDQVCGGPRRGFSRRGWQRSRGEPEGFMRYVPPGAGRPALVALAR